MGGRIGKAHSQPCILTCFDIAYRLTIKLHDGADRLVAHCPLPYEFIVIPNGNHVRRQANTSARQHALRPGLNIPSITALGPISLEPPASTQRSQPNLSHMDPALRRLSPADGPTSGGTIITILGINFPQQIVFVKFGDLAVPTV